MATSEDRLMQWLRDAHAMENQATHMLAAQENRIENYPDLKARIARHRRESEHQADLIDG